MGLRRGGDEISLIQWARQVVGLPASLLSCWILGLGDSLS